MSGTSPRPAGAPDLADIRAAATRLEGQVLNTPFLHSKTLSSIFGCELWLKFENLQFTGSFKERGALNKLSQLPEGTAGVIAMSAGNHAQGVAHHSRRLGIPATIVMPKNTPFVKIDNTEQLGARVILSGDTVDDAALRAREIAADEGLTFIHPFDDAAIIAGQGTLGLEMIEARPDLDTIVVPIGGGGLISGIATAAKAIKPDISIIGAEAAFYPAVRQMLRGEPPQAGGRTIADGIAVKHPGKLTFEIIRQLVDDVLLVEEAAIERAILLLLEIEKTLTEGAGATGLATLISHPERFRGRKVALVLCGGNIDSRLLSAVIMRGLVRSHRLVRFAVVVPDSPGSLAELAVIVAGAGANIAEVDHHRAFSGRSVREVIVDFTLETRNEQHAIRVREALEEAGFTVRSMTAGEADTL